MAEADHNDNTPDESQVIAGRPGNPILRRLDLVIVAIMVVGIIVMVGREMYLQAVRRPPPQLSYLIKNLEVGIRQYDFVFGQYPPDASMDPRFDSGAECLVYYLGTSFRRTPRAGKSEVQASKNGGPFFEFRDDCLADTDGDGLKEVIDTWGRPLCYDNVRDDAGGFTDCSGPSTGPDPRGGTGKNPNHYDIWSQGPTGGKDPKSIVANFRP